MKKSYRVYQVDSFTRERFTGNPAGVVSDADGLSDVQMQRIARELNNSETAFMLSDETGESDVHVRFFTPTREVPICGHATVAAHYVRAKEANLGNSRVLQRTGAGVLPVEVLKDGDDYRIVMTQGKISIGSSLEEPHVDRLIDALRIDRRDLRSDCPVVVASTGHSKVMVGIRDISLLHGLSPDMSELKELSMDIGCNGYYVFTLHRGESPLIHGRMFAPAIGITEDPVTGNANGPLGAYLVNFGIVECGDSELSFDAVQGEAIGRGGRMGVKVKITDGKPVEVRIIGEAVVAFSTEIKINE
ncbi:MAG: PhzF family isomerase [Synergistota bacterium]|nr:PhzF family isomerase [Synergistota bacterium]